jgi:hypothetical protein
MFGGGGGGGDSSLSLLWESSLSDDTMADDERIPGIWNAPGVLESCVDDLFLLLLLLLVVVTPVALLVLVVADVAEKARDKIPGVSTRSPDELPFTSTLVFVVSFTFPSTLSPA